MSSSSNSRTDLKYLLVLDFEATCSEEHLSVQEIIEFPTLVYNLESDEVVDNASFHEYVRPVGVHRLTEFCTQLTGITQASASTDNSKPRKA